MESVTIIGGGTAGLFLARELKEKGIESIVYEEHKELGKPVHDSGIFSKNLLEFVPELEKISLNTVKGARLYSPGNKVVELERGGNEAYILERHLLEETLSKGLNIEIGKKVEKIDFESKYVIGADGINSTVARLAEFPQLENFLSGIEYEIENTGTHEKEFLELYFGSKIAPGFFAWIVPAGKNLRVGLAAKEKPKDYLDKFLTEKFGKAEILKTVGGRIPIGWRKKFTRGNIALVGDAAGQVKPTTGGGVYIGMASGRILADAIEKNNIAFYEKEWGKKIKPELENGLKVRKFLDSLPDKELDGLFNILQDEKIKNLILQHGDMDKPTKLLRTLLTKPKLIGELLPYIKYLWQF